MQKKFILAATLVLSMTAIAPVARAQEHADEAAPMRFDRAGRIELEPHMAIGLNDIYGTAGYGGGFRVGVPVLKGAITWRDDVALDLGADILHYQDCYFGGRCHADYLFLPAAVQWNVHVVSRLTLFAEVGAFAYKGFYDGCGPVSTCSPPPDFGVLPTGAIGSRIHLSRSVSLTARIGYPIATLGVSVL